MSTIATTTPNKTRKILIELLPAERLALMTCSVSAPLAYMLPYPATKVVLGAVLGLVFLRVAVEHFHVAVALFAFSLPLQLLLPQDSLLGIRGLNVQTATVIGFFVLAAISGDQRGHPAPGSRTPGLRQIVFLISVILLSSLHAVLVSNDSFGDLFARIKNWFIYSAFLWLTYRYVHRPREKLFVVLFIFLVTILAALHSLNGVLNQGAAFNLMRHRAVSMIVTQPNLWAGYLAMYLFFFIAFLVHYPLTVRHRALFYGATLIVIVNLVYTMSRGAWLATLGAIFFVTTLKSRRLLIPIALVAGALYLVLPDVAVDRFRSGFEGEYDPKLLTQDDLEAEEAASRIIQWRAFLPMLAENPVIGVGFGQYAEVFYRSGFGEKMRSAHSTIIEIAVENGVLGLIAYLALLYSMYRRASEILKRAPEPIDRVLALGLVGATACLFLLDVTGTRFRNGNIMAFFWVFAGMAFNARLAPPVTRHAAAPHGVVSPAVTPRPV